MTIALARDTVGPTAQRVRHAGAAGVEIHAPVTDRKVARKNWRMINVVETMHREGKIDDRRWSAWQRFYRDWVQAEMGSRVIQKYGSSFGGGGTPEWQISLDAFAMADEREKFRIDRLDRLRYALEAISAPKMQVALVMAAGVECSLDTIGERVCNYADRNKRMAVAFTLIDCGLWLLYNHYQRLYGQSVTQP